MTKVKTDQIVIQLKNVLVTTVVAMVLAIGFFFVAVQLLPKYSGFNNFWCLESLDKQQEDVQPPHSVLSEASLQENLNISSTDLNHEEAVLSEASLQENLNISSTDLNHEEAVLSEASLQENLNISSTDLNHEEVGEEVRVFKPHGLAAHLYIEMSAYRGGPGVFSMVGLASKPVEDFHRPRYDCEWKSGSTGQVIKGKTKKLWPDLRYGRLYKVVVTTCYFAEHVGVGGEGGELILYASYGDPFSQPERIVALTEAKGEYNSSIFDPRAFPYHYVYCGSPVYGNISPQRIREWMAYHAKFFGEKSYFILYDAGGFQNEVRKVLEPWIKQGRVSVQNIRQQEIYDGYYHNQFLVLNDCLFRSRFMANWTFFFDIDEYMYVEPSTNLSVVLNSNPNATQFAIEQVQIQKGMCVADKTTKTDEHKRKWGFEKLVYKKILKQGVRSDRKYAVQARHSEATGVHTSRNMRSGVHIILSPGVIRYYHYHGTITNRDDICSIYVDPRNQKALRKHQVSLDMTMAEMAKDVKSYELKTIGNSTM